MTLSARIRSIILVLVLVTVSCSKEEVAEPFEKLIVGKWVIEKVDSISYAYWSDHIDFIEVLKRGGYDDFITFSSDGTGLLESDLDVFCGQNSFNWEVNKYGSIYVSPMLTQLFLNWESSNSPTGEHWIDIIVQDQCHNVGIRGWSAGYLLHLYRNDHW